MRRCTPPPDFLGAADANPLIPTDSGKWVVTASSCSLVPNAMFANALSPHQSRCANPLWDLEYVNTSDYFQPPVETYSWLHDYADLLSSLAKQHFAGKKLKFVQATRTYSHKPHVHTLQSNQLQEGCLKLTKGCEQKNTTALVNPDNMFF